MADVYEEIGGCGLFQICQSTTIQLTKFAAIFALHLMMFGNYDPGWECALDKDIDNSSLLRTANFDCEKDCGILQATNSEFQNAAVGNETKLKHADDSIVVPYDYNVRNPTIQDYYRNSCTFIISSCASVKFDPSSRTLVSEFSLICDKSFIPSIIICAQMLGMFLGAIVSGHLGERFGRKLINFGSSALCSLSVLLATFSPSWPVYALLIFFVGAGSSGVLVINGLYTVEFLEPKWRGRLSGVPVASCAIGLFVAVVFVLRDWVYLHVVAALMNGLACLGFFWSSESLRWLMTHGKHEEAERVIMKMTRMNRKTVGMAEIRERLYAHHGDQHPDRNYTYADLFRIASLRWVTVKLSLLWFTLTAVYYSMRYSVKSLPGDFYTNALITGLSEFPAVLIVLPMINTCGRRITTSVFCFVATFGCLTAAIVGSVVSGDISNIITTCAASIAKGACAACSNAIILFTAELYPTVIRNIATAFANTMGRVGAIVAPYLIPSDQTFLVICYTVIGLASAVSGVVALSLPETKKRPLRDHLGNPQDRISDVGT